MNKINKDWKEVKLGDIVDITMGQSPMYLCILILKHIQAILKR